MINLGAAMICDAVSIRENLLHVLGGGVTQIANVSYPAPFGSTLALMFYLKAPDAEASFAIEALCRHRESGDQVFVFNGDLVVNATGDKKPQSVSLPLDLSGMGLPATGEYEIVVSIDGKEVTQIPFTATQIPISPTDIPSAPQAE